jgi:hypothetical protein
MADRLSPKESVGIVRTMIYPSGHRTGVRIEGRHRVRTKSRRNPNEFEAPALIGTQKMKPIATDKSPSCRSDTELIK